MKVWVLVGYYGNTYEIDGAEVFGVFASPEAADHAQDGCEVGRGSGLVELRVTEHEVES